MSPGNDVLISRELMEMMLYGHIVSIINSISVQLRLAQLFFSGSKSVHAWCFEAILIANNYTPGSSKGNTCVLHTPKSNHKHSVSMVTTPPTVNKAIIIAHRL